LSPPYLYSIRQIASELEDGVTTTELTIPINKAPMITSSQIKSFAVYYDGCLYNYSIRQIASELEDGVTTTELTIPINKAPMITSSQIKSFAVYYDGCLYNYYQATHNNLTR
jgi:hypothetical protein